MTALTSHTALSVLIASSLKATVLLALAWAATSALRRRSAAIPTSGNSSEAPNVASQANGTMNGNGSSRPTPGPSSIAMPQ